MLTTRIWLEDKIHQTRLFVFRFHFTLARCQNQRSLLTKNTQHGAQPSGARLDWTSGDQTYYSSFLATALCCPSCGETLCRTNRPEKVREIPTHHNVIWASPKISWPRKACIGEKSHISKVKFKLQTIRKSWWNMSKKGNWTLTENSCKRLKSLWWVITECSPAYFLK